MYHVIDNKRRNCLILPLTLEKLLTTYCTKIHHNNKNINTHHCFNLNITHLHKPTQRSYHLNLRLGDAKVAVVMIVAFIYTPK